MSDVNAFPALHLMFLKLFFFFFEISMYVHLLVGGGFKGIFVEVLKCSFKAEQSFWPFWGKDFSVVTLHPNPPALTCTRRTPSPGPSC